MAITWKRILTEDDLTGLSSDDVARDNIVILAWKLAIASSLSIFNLEDGVVDEFEDATGIDGTNSLNESYNSTDDYYTPEGVTIDNMEYASDALAQAAYVTNAVPASSYPTLDTSHVKATSTVGTYYPHLTCDPAQSLIGSGTIVQWLSSNGSVTNQRFHIDLGSSKLITRIYYENSHWSGTDTDTGAKDFTLWGSDSSDSFSELTYGTNTGWTQLSTSASQFDQHVAANQADPKYITVYGTTPYRYYALKIVNNWGDAANMGIRRVELQTSSLQSYSESTIKTQGSYSLKGVATTDALNKTLTYTLGSSKDLTGQNTVKFDIRSDRTGSNIKIGIHDSGGTTTEITPNITDADTQQNVTWDISAVSDANKDAIDSIIITIVNADSDNTFYIDNFATPLENMTLISEHTEAEAEPTSARFLALVEPVDSITLNTDLKGWISNDNGSNYDQVTLTDEGYFDASKKIYAGNVSLTDRSDKTMVQKLTTHNNKNVKIHGWSMLWKT